MGVEDRCHILMITAGHDGMSEELADVPAIVAAGTSRYSSCPSADSLPGPGHSQLVVELCGRCAADGLPDRSHTASDLQLRPLASRFSAHSPSAARVDHIAIRRDAL